MITTVIQIVVVLGILGLLVYLLETYVPMASPFRLAIRLAVIIGLILWLARLASMWGVS